MKVLLIEPPMSPFDILQGSIGLPEPLALETVAAEVVEHHDVQILDMRVEGGLEERLQSFPPDVVGVGAVTSNLHSARDVLKTVKRFNPETVTLIGGHHASFRPEECLDDCVDVVVVGEGDHTVPETINALEQKRSLYNVAGLVLKKNGHPYFTPSRPLADLDRLKWPARHLAAHLSHHYQQRGIRSMASINSSRGCTNKCKFCTLWIMNKGQYRRRSAERLVEEIADLEPEFIDFIDDNSIADTEQAAEFSRLMIENGLNKRFKVYGRADTIAQNEALVEQLSAAGLEVMLVGFEACSDQALKAMNKRISPSTNADAIRVLRKYGIRIISYFVVDPRFDKEDFQQLWDYVDSMEMMDPVFTVLVPFPGSELYKERQSELFCHDYRLYDMFHTVLSPKLHLDEFYFQFGQLYQKAYAKERQFAKNRANVPAAALEKYVEGVNTIMSRIKDLVEHHALVGGEG